MNGNSKEFYKRALGIALPIMLQNGITNFVNMLDNIMVGRVGTNPMSGVSIVNQLIFVWNICLFGGLSGIGIFTAQYYGKGDEKGVRDTFRLQILLSALLAAAGLVIFRACDTQLIGLYLKGDGSPENISQTIAAAKSYLAVMCLGIIPFALNQCYSMTLRACGETIVPMRGSFLAVAVNLAGNYILIYGKFGAPALGVVGAALATLFSRVVEAVYVAGWTHRHPEKQPFIVNAWKNFRVPASLTVECLRKGTPLLLNETLWAGGQAVLTQTYSLRGLAVIGAFNISSTISNVFNVAFIAMGNAAGILIGQELGQGKLGEVKRDANRLSAFSVLICVIMGAGLFAVSGIFPHIYNTTDEIRGLATGLIRVSACCMPLYAYANSAYFTIRSGGKTFITFLFDSCFVWAVSIPAAWFLANHTAVPIVAMYFTVQMMDLVKCVIGFVLVQKGVWIQNMVDAIR